MTRRTATAIVFLALGTAWAADGPESANVRGESTTTRKRLVEAEQKVLKGKAAEAIDDLQRVLDDAGDDLVTADGKQFLAARQYAHQFLAKLPDADLKRYRDRVEEPAAKLLAAGRSRADERPLRELVARYAVSRPAEDAILLLADFAFERGEFAAAELYWRRLVPYGEDRYPSPKSDAALLKAKLVLSAFYRGDRAGAAKLLEAFEKDYAKATGHLAGKTGNLLETLVTVLNQPTAVPGTTIGESRWAALGGSASRDGRVSGPFPRHWPSRPTWKTPIPQVAGGKGGRPPSVGAVKSLAFHPVVMGSRAYVADAGRVIAFDLRTGTPEVVFDGKTIDRPQVPADQLRLPSPVDADYSLTAANGRLYFRYGLPDLFPLPEDDEQPVTKPSVLVCLVRPPGSAADALPSQILWKRLPPVDAAMPASWEGAPVVVGGTVLAAFVRSDGGRVVHAVACYRDDSDRPAWVADVCEESTASGRTRHELLTLAGRNVVFCSHSGVIAAVNADTGKHAWAYRYPRVRRYPADGRHRDLSPPVAADGRVFVAPNDADQLFAFDAESGRLLWQDGPILVDHLIGASAGKVVATIAGPQRGIRGYDTTTGSCDAPLGWRNHDDPFLPSFGRGLLSDDTILWPTAAALYSIRLVDGTVATQPLRGPHGNLAFAKGVLLVATPTEVWGYVHDTDDAEPPTPPLPKLLGAAPPLPKADEPVRVELPPRIQQPAKLERVSAAAEGLSVNLCDPYRDADNVRYVLRRTAKETQLVDSIGNVRRLNVGSSAVPVFAGNRVFFADARSVTIVNLKSGATERVFGLPDSLPDITRVLPLDRFVVLVLGLHQLVAADLDNKSLLWALDSLRRNRLQPHPIESAPRFGSLTALENQLAVQLSTGAWWVVDWQTGKVVREHAAADRPWRSDPVSLSGNRIVVAEGASRVSLFENGRRVWDHDAGREVSLTGDPAELRHAADSLFAFVHRNHGTEIELLKPTDGKPLWASGPALVRANAIDVNATDADQERLYVPVADRLVALKLDTGREAWDVPLPYPARWRAVATANALLVFPREAVAFKPASVLASFARYPHPRRAFGLLGTAAAEYFHRTVPLLLVDPRTGRLQQRLDLPAGGLVAVDVTADGVYVAAGGAIYRLQ